MTIDVGRNLIKVCFRATNFYLPVSHANEATQGGTPNQSEETTMREDV